LHVSRTVNRTGERFHGIAGGFRECGANRSESLASFVKIIRGCSQCTIDAFD
jgi:hypothetical protein